MKSIFKLQKVICIAVILTMVTFIMPVYSQPGGDVPVLKITPESFRIYQNDSKEILISVELDKPFDIANLSFIIKYDNRVFMVQDSAIELDPDEKLSSMGLGGSVFSLRGEINVSGENATNKTIEGSQPAKIANIKLQTKPDAPLGEYQLTFKNPVLVKVVDNNSEDTVPETVGATITVARKPGGSPGDSEAGKKYYEGNVTPSPSPSVSPSPSPSESPSESPDGSADPRGASKFKDLKPQHEWARTAIDELVKRGIISGTSDETFEPDRAITRAEFCKLIVSAFGFSDIDDTTSYSDVDEGAWYYSFVMAAAKAGLVTGYTEGDFRPNANITREEMAAILIRAYRAAGIPVPEGEMSFADTDEIGDWAAPFVAALVKMGIINGRDGNRFAPKDSLTRAETAKVTYSSLAFLEALLSGLDE